MVWSIDDFEAMDCVDLRELDFRILGIAAGIQACLIGWRFGWILLFSASLVDANISFQCCSLTGSLACSCPVRVVSPP
jgi:hypothetical protein